MLTGSSLIERCFYDITLSSCCLRKWLRSERGHVSVGEAMDQRVKLLACA